MTRRAWHPPTTSPSETMAQRPIDLFKGWPNPHLLPPHQINEAASHILSNPDNKDVLFYGPDEGYGPLLHEIAKWLSTFYATQPIQPARLCITGGASQNLACILQTFTDPVYTRNVWMVAPTYYLACRIFADSGFDGRMKAVPEDEQGIDLDYLEKSLRISEEEADHAGNHVPKLKSPKPWRKIYKHVIYAVPTFANPSGRIMSLGRRRALVRIARRYDALIVADDVYDMLQWSSSPNSSASSLPLDQAGLPRLVDVDRELDGGPLDAFGHAVSNGSFSKIVGPGVRTGWTEAAEAFAYGLSQTGSSRSGGAPSHLTASFISDMLATGTLQNHIRHTLQPAYHERYHLMMKAIREHLVPLGVTTPQADNDVAGGYFIWLTLPSPVDATSVWRNAQEEQLVTIPGPKFKVDGDEDNEATRFDRNMRLCFAYEEVALLEEGVRRLSRVVKQELQRSSETSETSCG